MNVEQARFNMIEQQIRPWNVLDAHVLHLLAVVKREDFLPAVHKALAFVDMEVPLQGHAGDATPRSSEDAMRLGQCMLAPRVEARLLQDLAVQKHEKVLEIGSGSGYMAALLAHRAQRVISLEIDADLATQARVNLQKSGVRNAEVRHADGARSVPVEGPFDVILLSGSVAEIPHDLLAHLKTGGRLAAIVGDDPVMRATFITRTSETQYNTTQPWDTVAPRLLNFPSPSRFSF
jgi:protein-L-isoaspartate(D-aspartate) O-methyltransferase